MYLYLYDNFLNAPKYNKILAAIEMRLTDLGIGGKISRISPLKNIKGLIHDEVSSGVNTIVAVGNDQTVTQIINDIVDLNITLGIIPIGPKNIISNLLGIPSPEEACPVLSARIIKKLDLGKVNNTYFLTNVLVHQGKVVLECDHKYSVHINEGSHEIFICNLKPAMATQVSQNLFNPSDGYLEAYIKPQKSISRSMFHLFQDKIYQESIFPFKKISIRGGDSQTIITEGNKILKTPARVEVVPKKLKVIVGKNRIF